ncbi:hypothetical protein [Actinomycetospora atypica]|uniref:Intradiol ring-cleavage dioxygenases domain-containing protein n=1 Tax=Actinomycetospora atypica TaxID=1290095 RepID=A0ABV9YK14_9PSEU
MTRTPRPAVGRRTALALGLAAPVALLAACATETAPRPAPGPVRVRTDWSRRPEGTAAAVGDEGAPVRVVLRDAPLPPVVRTGALVGQLPDAHGASYVNQDVGSTVVRIGADFAFGPGSEAGSLCLAAWTGVPYETPAVRTHCHFVLTPARWIYGVIEDGTSLRVIESGTYAAALRQDGTPCSTEAVITGPTASLTLPDGTTRAVSDPAIRALGGSWACWEFYKDTAGAADVRLLRSWAG